MLNDKSELKGASWPAILDDAAENCSSELFESRVQSRNLLRLNDDLADVFSELCHVLEQNRDLKFTRQCLKIILQSMKRLHCFRDSIIEAPDYSLLLRTVRVNSTGPHPIERDSYNDAIAHHAMPGQHNHATDRAATFMLQLLDMMRPGEAVLPRFGGMTGRPISFEAATNVCKTIAAVISNIFTASDVLEGSDGPIWGDKLSYLKEKIKEDPVLLAVSKDSDTSMGYDDSARFYTKPQLALLTTVN
ncbi:hypothetical protein PI125_g7450 [Phytophthora idaei]|nr:hypothetical protein PI125_g7450 [Phytophthora idaei]KAG3151506.1 hypothetical protein PI126_g10966 [Phytophthora idaei]